ncbi:LuxR C-terminal-related transcriptional regulator [Salaquimonas pukyongi]|uniref:LuxR C-terminal-related transcriptional regulator n=1 Tax=Salaquimonas pukyongi TaxID=2712698 RepID=UPI00096BBBAD|nr:LuxR C-terminal-related transcriptional regulator [Salaquimonas pukyongi]
MGAPAELSSIEENVMKYLVSGLTVGETAERLGLSNLLIGSVLKTVRRKLAAKTNLQAAARFAVQQRIRA